MGWFSRKQTPTPATKPATPAAADHECCRSDAADKSKASAAAVPGTASPKSAAPHECCGGAKHKH